MKNIEDLIIKEGNGKVVLLNTHNFHWARMSAEKFRNETATQGKKEKFSLYLDKKFGLLGDEEEQREIKSVYFTVTGKCNLNCSFCTMNSGPHVSTENDLKIEEIKDRLIPQLGSLNLRKIVITGGEPLVRNDIKEILYEFSKEFGRERIILQTNGLLLTPEFLLENVNYIGALEVSIENLFENLNLLSKMEQIFECANSAGILLSFSFVIDHNTLKYLHEGIDLCYRYKAALTTRIVSLVGRAKGNDEFIEFSTDAYAHLKIKYDIINYILEHRYFDEMLTRGAIGELNPAHSCGAYGRVLAVHPDGTVYMCGNFKDKKYSLGNIRYQSIDEILDDLLKKTESEEYKNIFRVDRNSNCKNCGYKFFCSGPCAAETAESENSLSEGNKCLYNKIMLNYILYYDRQRNTEDSLKHLASYIKECLNYYSRYEMKNR